MSVINRVYEILELLTQHNRCGLTNTEISKNLGLSTSTCHRLLKSLRKINFVQIHSHDHRYFLGDAHLRYADTMLESLDDAAVCLPYLESLHTDTEETTYYARFNGLSCVNVEICGYINTRISVRRGEVLPLHATASGMAVLAFFPEHQKQYLIDTLDFKPYTPTTITDKEELLKKLHEIGRSGVAYNLGGLHKGINAIATPVFDRKVVLGSITLIGTATDLNQAQLEEYAELFVQASIDITGRLRGDFKKWIHG